MTHSQIARAKETLKLSCDGPSQLTGVSGQQQDGTATISLL